MRTVGAYELKTNLSRYLDAVGRGETVIVTRNGTPTARLEPFSPVSPEAERERLRALFARLADIGRGVELEPGETLKDLIGEGRP